MKRISTLFPSRIMCLRKKFVHPQIGQYIPIIQLVSYQAHPSQLSPQPTLSLLVHLHSDCKMLQSIKVRGKECFMYFQPLDGHLLGAPIFRRWVQFIWRILVLLYARTVKSQIPSDPFKRKKNPFKP